MPAAAHGSEDGQARPSSSPASTRISRWIRSISASCADRLSQNGVQEKLTAASNEPLPEAAALSRGGGIARFHVRREQPLRRELDRDARASAEFALDREGGSVRFDQALGERQAKPGAGVAAAEGTVDLTERR